MTPADLPDAILDLLIERATDGLSAEDEARLGAALREHPDVDALGVDRTVACVDQAFTTRQAPLPPHLRARILQQAPRHLAAARSAAPVPFTPAPPAFSRTRRVVPWLGWAAAACLLAVVWTSGRDDRTTTPSEQRRRLLAEADVIRVPWAPSTVAGYERVTGDVVWSTRLQRGFLYLDGLPPNDRDEQYQLWIVDKDRDEVHPVDGGVFDVSTGAALIPITAKLDVPSPDVFAITLEKRGGTVVSRQGLLVTAVTR